MDNITCRKCEESKNPELLPYDCIPMLTSPAGHFSRDCPQGGGGRACHNCGQEGHMSKECEQPRNMDTVTCRNCEKTGHMSRDCPEPKDCRFLMPRCDVCKLD